MPRYKPYTTDDAARVHAAALSCPHRGPVVDSEPVPGCGCATVLCLSLVKVVGSVDCVACRAAELDVGTEIPDDDDDDDARPNLPPVP